MQALFLAGHPALDFLNTAFAPSGPADETIGDGRAYLRWLTDAGLLDAFEADDLKERFTKSELDRAAGEARQVREWTRAWIQRWRADPSGDYAAEIDALNAILARGACFRQVGAGLTLEEHNRFAGAGDLLALVAGEIASLITQERSDLVKSCAGTGCTLMFLDRTKARRRLFCSSSVCGNRAKVAAFRARQREG